MRTTFADILIWVSRPGYIRTFILEFDIRGFTVTLTEADSQPEFYDSTFVRASARCKDVLGAFDEALKKLESRQKEDS